MFKHLENVKCLHEDKEYNGYICAVFLQKHPIYGYIYNVMLDNPIIHNKEEYHVLTISEDNITKKEE